MKKQKIKSDTQISVGNNIQEIRKSKKIKQTELVRLLDLQGITITRESLVKIELGIQHIYASQLRGIKNALNTTYDKILK